MNACAKVVITLVLGATLLCGPPVIAQEEEDLTAGLQVIREAFERARRKSDELDFQGAIGHLRAIIDPRRAQKAPELGLEELRLLTAAYDLRARAHFNLGQGKAAASDFESLLRLDPSYAIDRQSLSPKVVSLFDQVRVRIVAVLVLDIEPSGARVLLDGSPVDPAVVGSMGLLAGNHEVRVEKEGFVPHIVRLSAGAGGEIRKSIRLRPNRRAVEFITVPTGTTVRLDGEIVGTTWGPAPPEIAALAERLQFDPGAISAPLSVPLVTPGEHLVTFERECYLSRKVRVRVALDIEENAPLRLSPVVLEEARTDLRVTSVPSGADVHIDGVKRGTTPVTVSDLCGGTRDVRIVRTGVGSWNDRIRLTPGRINTLAARLRPTLLYAGTFRLDGWGRAIWSDEDGALLEELGKGLKTLNVVRSPEVLEGIRDEVIRWMIADPVEVRAGTILPPEILKKVATRTDADLVLAGLTFAGDPRNAWTLALYSVLHAAPDVTRLRTDTPKGVQQFVRRLDSVPPASEPWWGMGLADSTLRDDVPETDNSVTSGRLVVRVLPGGPAAKAGLLAGDRIGAVENRRVRSVADVHKALSEALDRPGGVKAPVTLKVGDRTSARTVRLAPGASPVIVPLSDPKLFYNRVLAEFRLRTRTAGDERERGMALLNLGVAFMHFRSYDRALAEGFGRASLPEGSGISAGTVLYYRGLCALRGGDPGAAREAFEEVARQPASTVGSGDGPAAAAAAVRLLRSMR